MSQQTVPEQGPKKIWGMHPNVFFLGVVSFLTDVSSELIFTLVPLVVVNILGGGAISVGIIGGVTESFDAFFRIFSGRISDKMGKRKILAVFGYGFSTLVKPIMLLNMAWGGVLAVRFGDRLGKGVRSSPRDALIADSVTLETRGKAFGVHKTMDTAGAFIGLVISAIIIYAVQGGGNLTMESYRWMVIIGIIPAVLAVIILIALVREKGQDSVKTKAAGAPAALKAPFSMRFKLFLAVMGIFTLGNSSDFFVILRAENLGVSAFNIALMLVLFNLTYLLVSTPSGILSDKLGRRKVIGIGWAVYALCYLGFALSNTVWHVWLLFAAYGIYYGVVEGATKAFVADLVPPERRGTAYGYYQGLVVSPATPFYLGAGLAALAGVGMMAVVKEK